MSVQIHTEDPINAAKASGITSQTAHNSNTESPQQPGQTTSTASTPYAYPPAQPGAAAPTHTSTLPQSSSYGPPAPQPGAAPVPPPPTITAGPSVPPPPKAGEKPLSAEHYKAVHSRPAQPQPYPSQVSQPLVDHPVRAVPAGSTTSTSTEPFFNPSTQPSNMPSSTDMPARASLDHPPGYVQNPFAADMTPDQRFTAQQEQEKRSEILPSLGYIDNSKGERPGLEDDQTVWGTAKKWAKGTGEQASKLREEVWNQFGPGS